jgi:hypothetical protein
MLENMLWMRGIEMKRDEEGDHERRDLSCRGRIVVNEGIMENGRFDEERRRPRTEG